jgi:hypothetical protein
MIVQAANPEAQENTRILKNWIIVVYVGVGLCLLIAILSFVGRDAGGLIPLGLSAGGYFGARKLNMCLLISVIVICSLLYLGWFVLLILIPQAFIIWLIAFLLYAPIFVGSCGTIS